MIIEQKLYNGDLIHERFAYRFFRKGVSPYGNIISFIAPMEVTVNLVDLEDSLQKDYIYSNSAINFCWEIPNLCPLGAVAFQRLFNTTIATILSRYIERSIEVDGDDLMVHDSEFKNGKGKVSVSITYSKDNVTLGHTGINIDAGDKAPDFAYSTNLEYDRAIRFMQDVNNTFYEMVQDMFVATTKISV